MRRLGWCEVRGDGHFSLLGGLLYNLRTTTASSGKVTDAGPEPKMYLLSYASGGDSGQLRMSFDAGAVTTLSIIPRRDGDPREIPVTKEQLVGALDPIAAAFFQLVPTTRMAISRSAIKQCRCSTEDGGLTLCSRPKSKVSIRKCMSPQ